MYTKQYHVFQPIQLTNNVNLPESDPINVTGGDGGTVTVPELVGVVSGYYVTIPSVIVEVDGGAVGASVTIPELRVRITSGTLTTPELVDLPVDGDGVATVTIPASDPIPITSPDNATRAVNAFVTFPVKKIKISFAYTISSEANALYTVTSDIVRNDIVGSLNNFSFFENPLAWYSDSFKETNVFSYIFRDPLQVSGAINFTFTNQVPSDSVSTNNVVVHLEFLG